MTTSFYEKKKKKLPIVYNLCHNHKVKEVLWLYNLKVIFNSHIEKSRSQNWFPITNSKTFLKTVRILIFIMMQENMTAKRNPFLLNIIDTKAKYNKTHSINSLMALESFIIIALSVLGHCFT